MCCAIKDEQWERVKGKHALEFVNNGATLPSNLLITEMAIFGLHCMQWSEENTHGVKDLGLKDWKVFSFLFSVLGFLLELCEA